MSSLRKIDAFSSFPGFGDASNTLTKDEESDHSNRRRKERGEGKKKRRKSRSKSPKSKHSKRRRDVEDSKASVKRAEPENDHEPPSFGIDTRPDMEMKLVEAPHSHQVPKYHTRKRAYPSELTRGTSWKDWEHDEPPARADLLLKAPEVDSIAGNEDFVDIKPTAVEADDDETEASVVAENSSFFAKQQQLNRAVADEPGNLGGWMELLDFQEEYFRVIFKSQKRRRRDLEERKLSICERALQHHPQNAELITLILSINKELLDSSQMLKKWEEVLKQHPRHLILHLGYLAYHQCTSSLFSYFECRDLHEHTMKTSLSGLPPGARMTVASRVTWLDYASGYRERALSILFASLESLNYPLLDDPVLEILEQRWDGGQPFIGDSGSYIQPSLTQSGTTWIHRELELAEHAYPVRSISAEEDTDPESVVLFEDIHPFITRPSNVYDVCVLLQNLLGMFGIYAPLPTSTVSSRVDPLICSTTAEEHFRFYPLIFEMMFYSCEPVKIDQHAHVVISQTFQSLLDTFKDDTILTLYAYFEYRVSPIKAKAMLKTRLQQFPNQLYLWVLYACIERAQGNGNEMIRVCDQILVSKFALPIGEMQWLTVLCRLSAEVLLQLGDLQGVRELIERLFCGVNETRLDDEALLARAKGLSLRVPGPDSFGCLAYLTYAISGFQPTLLLFETWLSQNTERHGDLLHEHMTYIYANFLHLHYISAKSYQPQDVRDFVESSWRMYPRNTRLLEIFVECERKFKLQHRVFTSIDEAFAGKHHTLAYWMILMESERLFHGMPSPPSLKSRLESAVEHEEVKQCPNMWRRWFRLVKQPTESQLLSALTACPSAKQLYLIALQHTTTDHSHIHDLLLERDLRLYESRNPFETDITS